MLFASPVWHFWIGVALFVPVLLLTVVTIGLYLQKVERPRYPRADQERS